ncbi:MAG: zinc ribbon domain-containing protein [Candidatus Bathyarchaeia archaeon]
MVKKCPTCGANNRDDAAFCSACGASLTVAAPFAAPTVKPVPSVRVVSPVAPAMAPAPVRVPPPGMCYYHPNLPAVYVCNRCGRPICRDDAKAYSDLILCPQCYLMVPPPAYYAPVPAAPPPVMAPPPPAMPPPAPAAVYPPARATWGFLTSLIAGIMIIINAAALLSLGFYTFWSGIFPWITYFGAFPPWMLFAIGIILGVIVCIGSVLMILGYGTIGAVVVMPAAIISLILGGGFIVGFVLGIVGGILGMLGR